MTSVGGRARRVLDIRRRPALLLLAVLAVPTAVFASALLREVIALDPAAAALLILLTAGVAALLVALVGLLAGGVIPRAASAAALVWGALAAPTVAAPADGMWGETLASILAGSPDSGWAAALSAGPVEETIKLLGVALVAVGWPGSIRGARSGLVAGILVGIGFGGIEDALYLAIPIQVGANDGFGAVGWIFLAREVASGLFLHAAFTGIAGATLGWALGGASALRWAGVCGGLAIAILLHVLANAGPMMPPDLPWTPDELPSLAANALVRSVPIAVVCWLLVRLRPRRVARTER